MSLLLVEIKPISGTHVWKTINEIISKSPPKKQFPNFFRDGRKEITENCEIANKFNTLFTHIGPDQSKNINYTGDKTHLKEPNKVSISDICKSQ